MTSLIRATAVTRSPIARDAPGKTVTRVLIVCRDEAWVDGLAALINGWGEIQVIGIARSLADGVAAAATWEPDVVITGQRTSGGDGATVTAEVLTARPETKVIVITDTTDPEADLRCFAAGCSGLVAKTLSADDLVRTIRRVRSDELVIPASILAAARKRMSPRGQRLGDDITPREHEVLEHLARGAATGEIAVEMSISPNTVRNHIQRLLAKLGAHSKLEAVVVAAQGKLVDVM